MYGGVCTHRNMSVEECVCTQVCLYVCTQECESIGVCVCTGVYASKWECMRVCVHKSVSV